MNKKTKNPNHQEQHEEGHEHDEKTGEEQVSIIMPPSEGPDVRILGLYGIIEEEKCAGIISMLYHMRESGKHYVPVNPEEPEGEVEEHISPLEFIVSTEGGSAMDMFSVYDVMRDVLKTCEISTFGVGRVMSAGVLLLAAGTKGKRRVGKNCRLMIHNVSSGHYGAIHDLENNVKETKWYQERYIKCLSELSNLDPKKIKAIFRKKIDYFFDAEQALKWGIVDSIV